MKSSEKPAIITVIPCLNEERFIADIVREALRHVDRVLVIDDGSTDATATVAKKAGAEVISHATRKGAGAATRSGFEEAIKLGADIVVTLDGDGQHNPAEIPLLLQPLLQGDADLVIGSRFIKHETNIPAYRKLGVDFITWMYNLGTDVKVTDAQSGFRAHSRKLLESVSITREDFSFSVEVLVKARKKGFRIEEVPISCLYHDRGSTSNPIFHGLSVVFAVAAIRLSNVFLSGAKK
jgi:glycosyltransferase involved in cell wall biosynthesis